MINFNNLQNILEMDFKRMRSKKCDVGYCATDEAIEYFVNNLIQFYSQFTPKGHDFHLMTELPQSPEPYKNSYIIIKNDDIQELYYTKTNGNYERVKIDNFDLLEHTINAIRKMGGTKLYLSEHTIKQIVTLNGGHTPPILTISPTREVLNIYNDYMQKILIEINKSEIAYYFDKYIHDPLDLNTDDTQNNINKKEEIASMMANLQALKNIKDLTSRMQFWAASEKFGDSLRNSKNHKQAVNKLIEWSTLTTRGQSHSLFKDKAEHEKQSPPEHSEKQSTRKKSLF